MIGIFGGSFDPPHLGHQSLVRWSLDLFPKIDTFYIVPNAQSPFKGKKHFPNELIYKLCQRNFHKLDPRVQISDFEFHQSPPSYTIDTILHFKGLDPSLILFMGADSWESFPHWKDNNSILENCSKLVIFQRKGVEAETHRNPEEKLLFVTNPFWNYESTNIRNLPLSEWKLHLDADVWKEIQEWENEFEKF